MTGKATLQISSDTKDGQKAIETLVKEMQKLKEENKQLAENNRKAAKEAKEQAREKSEANRKLLSGTKELDKAQRDAGHASEMFAKAGTAAWMRFGATIATTAGGFVSVNTLMAEANRLLERQAQLQQEIHSKSMALGQSQANTAINFAGLSPDDRKTATGIAGRVNLRAGFGNRPALENAAGSLISAGASPQQAEKTLEYAANLSPGNAQMVESLGSGIVDLQGSTGMSIEEASNLLLSSAANSRVKDPQQVSKGLAKVTSNASSLFDKGGKALAGEEGAAVWASISRMRGDSTGDESATLANNAITKLSTFAGFGADAPTTIMGRIAALQSNPELAKRFIKDSGYTTQDPAIGRMLTDKGFGYARMLGEIDKNIGYTPDMAGAVEELHRTQPDIALLKSQNRVKTLGERGAEANRAEAYVKIAEEARLKAHEAVDVVDTESIYMGRLQSMERGVTDMTGTPVDRIRVRKANTQALLDNFNQSPKDIPDDQRESIRQILSDALEIQREQLEQAKLLAERANKPTVDTNGMQEAN